MNDYQTIISQHHQLQQRLSQDRDAVPTDQLLDFLSAAREAGAHIASPEQREQLRAILRVWGAAIYERTGDYPPMQLAPHAGAPGKTDDVTTSDGPGPERYWLVGGAALFLILATLLALTSLSRSSRGHLAAIEMTNAAIEATNLMVTQTIAAMEAQATQTAALPATESPLVDVIATQIAIIVAETATAQHSSDEATAVPTRPPTATPTPTPGPSPTPDPLVIRADNMARLTPIHRLSVENPLATLATRAGAILQLAFAPDGRLLASGGADGLIRLWDVAGEVVVAAFQAHQGWLQTLTFTPDGRLLLSGGNDGLVRAWSVEGGQLFAEFTGHRGYVFAVVASPDGRLLASGGGDGLVNVWDLEGGSLLTSVAVGLSGERIQQQSVAAVHDLAFAPDGQRLAAARADGFIYLIDIFAETMIICDQSEAFALSVAFAPDGDAVAVGFDNGGIVLLDSRSCELLARWHDHQDGVNALAVQAAGRLLVSGSRDGTMQVRSLDRLTAAPAVFPHHQVSLETVAVSADGRTIASGDVSGLILVWAISANR